MAVDIRTLEGVIDVYVPGSEEPVEANLSSCIFDGLVLRLNSGPHIRALHRLISDGQVMSLTLTLKEKEPDGNPV